MKEQIQFTQEINNNKLNKYSFRRIVATGAFVLSAGGVLAACGSSSTAQETFTMNAKQAGQGTQKCSPGEGISPIFPLASRTSLSGSGYSSNIINQYINYLYSAAISHKDHTIHYDKNQGTIQALPNPNETFGNNVFKLSFKPPSSSSLPAVNLTTNSNIANIYNLAACRENNQLYSTVYDQAIINAIKVLHIEN